MWPLIVALPDPTIDHNPDLAQLLEAMEPDALLLPGTEETLDEPVLLRGIRRRELMREALWLHRADVVSTAENEPLSDRRANDCKTHPSAPSQ